MPLALLSALCHSPARLPLPGSRRAGTRRVTTSRRAANARAVVLIRVRTGDSTCWPSTDYTYHTNQHAVHLGVVLASCFRPPRTRYVPPVSLSSSLCTSPPVAASPAHFTRESLARASREPRKPRARCLKTALLLSPHVKAVVFVPQPLLKRLVESHVLRAYSCWRISRSSTRAAALRQLLANCSLLCS